MKSNNVFVNQLLTFFLVSVLLTLTAPLSAFSQQSSILESVTLSNKSETKKSNIIRDLNQDDIKASIIEYSENQLILKIWKGSEVLGTAEVYNEKDSQRTTFTTSSGAFFSLITTKSAKNFKNTLPIPNSQGINSENNIYNVSLRTLKDSVTLSLLQFQGEAEISPLKQKKVQKILSEIAQNDEISQLMKATRDFTSEDNFTDYLEWDGDTRFDCARDTSACLVAAIAWIGSVAALDAACPATFGLTCAAALIAHGVLGGNAALQCSNAIGTCSNGPRPIEPVVIGIQP